MPAGLPRLFARACVALLALLISAAGGLRISTARLDEPTALECRCDQADDGARLVVVPARPQAVGHASAALPTVSRTDVTVSTVADQVDAASTSVLRSGSAGGPRAP